MTPKPTAAARTKALAEKAAAYKIAYNEGRATIASQAVSLKEVRDRAGLVATTAAAIAALAVGLVFSQTSNPGNPSGAWWHQLLSADDSTSQLQGWGVVFIAIAGFGFLLVTVAIIVVWWPATVTFNMDAEMLIEKWANGDPPMGEAEMHRWLAYYSGRHARANVSTIDRRLLWFSGSLVGLALETGGLIAMVIEMNL